MYASELAGDPKGTNPFSTPPPSNPFSNNPFPAALPSATRFGKHCTHS